MRTVKVGGQWTKINPSSRNTILQAKKPQERILIKQKEDKKALEREKEEKINNSLGDAPVKISNGKWSVVDSSFKKEFDSDGNLVRAYKPKVKAVLGEYGGGKIESMYAPEEIIFRNGKPIEWRRNRPVVQDGADKVIKTFWSVKFNDLGEKVSVTRKGIEKGGKLKADIYVDYKDSSKSFDKREKRARVEDPRKVKKKEIEKQLERLKNAKKKVETKKKVQGFHFAFNELRNRNEPLIDLGFEKPKEKSNFEKYKEMVSRPMVSSVSASEGQLVTRADGRTFRNRDSPKRPIDTSVLTPEIRARVEKKLGIRGRKLYKDSGTQGRYELEENRKNIRNNSDIVILDSNNGVYGRDRKSYNSNDNANFRNLGNNLLNKINNFGKEEEFTRKQTKFYNTETNLNKRWEEQNSKGVKKILIISTRGLGDIGKRLLTGTGQSLYSASGYLPDWVPIIQPGKNKKLDKALKFGEQDYIELPGLGKTLAPTPEMGEFALITGTSGGGGLAVKGASKFIGPKTAKLVGSGLTLGFGAHGIKGAKEGYKNYNPQQFVGGILEATPLALSTRSKVKTAVGRLTGKINPAIRTVVHFPKEARENTVARLKKNIGKKVQVLTAEGVRNPRPFAKEPENFKAGGKKGFFGTIETTKYKGNPLFRTGDVFKDPERVPTYWKRQINTLFGKTKGKGTAPKAQRVPISQWKLARPTLWISENVVKIPNTKNINKFYDQASGKEIVSTIAPKTLLKSTQPEFEVFNIANNKNLAKTKVVNLGIDELGSKIRKIVPATTTFKQRLGIKARERLKNIKLNLNRKDLIAFDTAQWGLVKGRDIAKNLPRGNSIDNSGRQHVVDIQKIGRQLAKKTNNPINKRVLDAFAEVHDIYKQPTYKTNIPVALSDAVKKGYFDELQSVKKLNLVEKRQVGKLIRLDEKPPINIGNLKKRLEDTIYYGPKRLTNEEKIIINADRLARFGNRADPDMIFNVKQGRASKGKIKNPTKVNKKELIEKIGKNKENIPKNPKKQNYSNFNEKYEDYYYNKNKKLNYNKGYYSRDYKNYMKKYLKKIYKEGYNPNYEVSYKGNYPYPISQYSIYPPNYGGGYTPNNPYNPYGGSYPYNYPPTSTTYTPTTTTTTTTTRKSNKSRLIRTPEENKRKGKRKKWKGKRQDVRIVDPFYRITGKQTYSDSMLRMMRDRYGGLFS